MAAEVEARPGAPVGTTRAGHPTRSLGTVRTLVHDQKAQYIGFLREK